MRRALNIGAVTADVFSQREIGQAIDYFHLQLHYGRMRAILHSFMLAARPGPHFAVYSDAGSFFKYGMDPQEEALAAGKLPGDADWAAAIADGPGEFYPPGEPALPVEILPGAWQSFYAGLANALHGGAPVPVDAADARDGLLIVEAALRSASQRRTVDLSPAA